MPGQVCASDFTIFRVITEVKGIFCRMVGGLLYCPGVIADRFQCSPKWDYVPLLSLASRALCRPIFSVVLLYSVPVIRSLLSSNRSSAVPRNLNKLWCDILAGWVPACDGQRLRLGPWVPRLRYWAVSWAHFICGFGLGNLVLPGWALATPYFVVAPAGRTFPWRLPVRS